MSHTCCYFKILSLQDLLVLQQSILAEFMGITFLFLKQLNVPVGSFEYNFITNSGWLTYHGKCVINYEYLRIYDFCKTLKASVLISSKNSCNSDLIEQRKCKANNEKLKSRKISPSDYIGPADFRCSFGLYCFRQFSA